MEIGCSISIALKDQAVEAALAAKPDLPAKWRQAAVERIMVALLLTQTEADEVERFATHSSSNGIFADYVVDDAGQGCIKVFYGTNLVVRGIYPPKVFQKYSDDRVAELVAEAVRDLSEPVETPYVVDQYEKDGKMYATGMTYEEGEERSTTLRRELTALETRAARLDAQLSETARVAGNRTAPGQDD